MSKTTIQPPVTVSNNASIGVATSSSVMARTSLSNASSLRSVVVTNVSPLSIVSKGFNIDVPYIDALTLEGDFSDGLELQGDFSGGLDLQGIA